MIDTEEIQLNKYAQGLVEEKEITIYFCKFNVDQKREYLRELSSLIIQSKPEEEDISNSIVNSKLRTTFTPCVLLRKGGKEYHNLIKIIHLPEEELDKVLILFLHLFKIAYQRRYLKEKNTPYKWWYWDMSDPERMRMIENACNL